MLFVLICRLQDITDYLKVPTHDIVDVFCYVLWHFKPLVCRSSFTIANERKTHAYLASTRCGVNSIKYTHTQPFNGSLSVTTRVSRYQKGKTNLDFTEARDSEWQWHQLDDMQVCSAPRSRQITTPAPHQSVFTGRMPFLPPNQQCQSTEGSKAKSKQWFIYSKRLVDSAASYVAVCCL